MNVLPYGCFRDWYWIEAAQRLVVQRRAGRLARQFPSGKAFYRIEVRKITAIQESGLHALSAASMG